MFGLIDVMILFECYCLLLMVGLISSLFLACVGLLLFDFVWLLCLLMLFDYSWFWWVFVCGDVLCFGIDYFALFCLPVVGGVFAGLLIVDLWLVNAILFELVGIGLVCGVGVVDCWLFSFCGLNGVNCLSFCYYDNSFACTYSCLCVYFKFVWFSGCWLVVVCVAVCCYWFACFISFMICLVVYSFYRVCYS